MEDALTRDMKPLTIHFFVNFIHPQGTYFRFHNLAVGLKKLGQNVTIFANDHDMRSQRRVEIRDGIEYHILPNSKTARIFNNVCDPLTTARRRLQAYSPCDIAHLFQPFPCAAAAWNKVKAKAKFYDWDDLWDHQTGPRTLRPLRQHWPKMITAYCEQRLPRMADHVTAIDHFLANLAQGRNAKRTSILYNPSLDLPRIEKQEARSALGLDATALYVGFMGFTLAELDWCFQAVEQNKQMIPNLRFALCGPDASILKNQSAAVVERTDCLGRISQQEARTFASALDLALLPLEDSVFNRSRFPIKFSEYLMAGTPVLTSEIGECSRFVGHMPGVVGGGKTKEAWLQAFQYTVEVISQDCPPYVNAALVEEQFAADTVCCRLLKIYQAEILA